MPHNRHAPQARSLMSPSAAQGSLRSALCLRFCFGLCLGLSISACSSAPDTSPRGAEGLPSWVLSPPQGLCGVGSSPLGSSKALARTAATARGRAALAARVAVEVKALLQASGDVGDGAELTRRVSAQRVSQGLIGSQLHREHSAQRELFALVCISSVRVQEALERELKAHELRPTLRSNLRARARASFDELEEELQRAFADSDPSPESL